MNMSKLSFTAFQRCNLYVSRILNVNLTLKQHVHWYIFHVIQASVSSGVEFHTECDEYIRIFEYSNILGTNIYSDIHSGQFCLYEYIRTFVRVKFVCTNIFGHSFMSVLESENRPNIRIYSNIRTIFNTNIYSDIRSCQIFYTNIFGHSFV